MRQTICRCSIKLHFYSCRKLFRHWKVCFQEILCFQPDFASWRSLLPSDFSLPLSSGSLPPTHSAVVHTRGWTVAACKWHHHNSFFSLFHKRCALIDWFRTRLPSRRVKCLQSWCNKPHAAMHVFFYLREKNKSIFKHEVPVQDLQAVRATGPVQQPAYVNCVHVCVSGCRSADPWSGLKWQICGHAEQSGAAVVIVMGDGPCRLSVRKVFSPHLPSSLPSQLVRQKVLWLMFLLSFKGHC